MIYRIFSEVMIKNRMAQDQCKNVNNDEHLLCKEPELAVKADVSALLKSKSDLVRLLCVVSTLLSLVSPRNVLSHPGVLPCMF